MSFAESAFKTNQAYILYVAIAMIGLSFIAFLALGRSTTCAFVANVPC